MPTTISQVNIVNAALSRIGVAQITGLDDVDSVPADQATLQWPLVLSTVARETPWNCLLKPAVLQPVAQDPINPATPFPAATAWAPATNYVVGEYVTFGSPAYYYQALIANLSSASFVNDLTQGYWFQTDLYNADPFAIGDGSLYPSGYAYKYPLPEDCVLVYMLNGQLCSEMVDEYQIMGSNLYTNKSTAVIQYVWPDPDTTRYDTKLVECLTFKLAAALATMLRQDDTTIEQTMEAIYQRKLSGARTKNGGEGRRRRFNPVYNSRFLNSRRFSTNS